MYDVLWLQLQIRIRKIITQKNVKNVKCLFHFLVDRIRGNDLLSEAGDSFYRTINVIGFIRKFL